MTFPLISRKKGLPNSRRWIGLFGVRASQDQNGIQYAALLVDVGDVN